MSQLLDMVGSGTYGHKAVQIMERPGTTQCPPHIKVRDDGGIRQFVMKDYPGPMEYCDAILELDPGNVQVRQVRGEALLNPDRYDEAIASFDRVMRCCCIRG